MAELTRHKPSLCALVQKTWQACGRLSSGAHFKIGLLLLLGNQPFGWLGLALGALLTACTGNSKWGIIGSICYGISWLLLGLGLLICGRNGRTVSKITKQKWRAWKRLRNACTALALLLCLNGCTTVEIPKRPLAYIYPSLFPMSELQHCHKRQSTPQEIPQILQKARLRTLIEQHGFLKSDYSIVARGLSKHGYAEIDARSCNLCPVKWLALWYDGACLNINASFNGSIPQDVILKDSVIIRHDEIITRLPF